MGNLMIKYETEFAIINDIGKVYWKHDKLIYVEKLPKLSELSLVSYVDFKINT